MKLKWRFLNGEPGLCAFTHVHVSINGPNMMAVELRPAPTARVTGRMSQ